MTEDFEILLDPAPRPGESVPAPTGEPAPRGIPEVTRPGSRLALPSMLAGAALLTLGFVYSVSSAGEAAPVADASTSPIEAAPAPPPAPAHEIPASRPVPSPARSAPPVPAEPVGRSDRVEEAADAAAAARLEARRRSPLLVAGAADPVDSGAAPEGQPPPFERQGGPDNTPARARVLADTSAVVVEGTLVPAVLETALDSSLPGMLRAVVAADVTGFDGRRVLIPRGSRLIGHYRASDAVGQARAFVIWTRLVTPAGTSVALASPGTDALGRAGLGGRVDRHFFERFGAALLLSVVGSGVQAAASSRGDDITINAASDAGRLAEAALRSSVDIPPTIKVRQGTPILVLVARDLDFAAAGAG